MKPEPFAAIRRLIRRLLCPHRWLFVRNIYGDEIIACGYKRSVWQCDFCHKTKWSEQLARLDKKEFMP